MALASACASGRQPAVPSASPDPVDDAASGAAAARMGCAVPFTGAQMGGLRVRRGVRERLEFVQSNPSGSRGFYIVPLTAIRAACAPTIHDLRLIDALTRLDTLDPAAIRQAAATVASEGFAGRAAARAAEAARQAQEALRVTLRTALTVTLARQLDCPDVLRRRQDMRLGETALRLEVPHETVVALETEWTTQAVAQLAPHLGWPPPQLAVALEDLARALLPAGLSTPLAMAGLNRAEIRGRLPRLLYHIRDLRAVWAQWPIFETDHRAAMLSALRCAADRILGNAARQLAMIEAAGEDTLLLLDLWRADPAAPAGLTASLDRVLDGWDRICLLWENATDASSRRGLLGELGRIAALLPGVAERTGGEPDVSAADDPREGPRLLDGGQMLSMVERNEQVRVLELLLDTPEMDEGRA